jgi:hypothetical protein
MAVTSEQRAHAQATQQGVASVAAYLQQVLGQRTTAVIAGVSDAKAVGKWARGERVPHPKSEQSLRDAYQVAQIIGERGDPATIRAWFRGMNPHLGDRAPALVVREQPGEVLRAARAFLANG